MTGLTILAPAKLNLGLEVVGRRADGFHDIVTIMQAIGLTDRLTLQPFPSLRFTCSDPALERDDNLALAALRALQAEAGVDRGGWLHLDKAIPAAAGLGGASSDAAAALLLARHYWAPTLADERLAPIAASLGSDVPFFLRGSTALASGRGERLEALPAPNTPWFVVATPLIAIPRKTATLYGELDPTDFSSGGCVRQQAAQLHSTGSLDPTLLRNAFCSPLYRLQPALERVPDAFRRAGAPFVALSGAGPSHYTAVDSEATARAVAHSLTVHLDAGTTVHACRPLNQRPAVLET
ncbi:MAG: 4-(cytidine 5'-diphospho)-2-C-methyl-D-erythritol kinase [Chloroflexota bacterium]|nr:4-(cytidine 5'-diphospho)-2-C-methyl-D-erythritol kinase [Chloroflexota bacterium]